MSRLMIELVMNKSFRVLLMNNSSELSQIIEKRWI
jgi:hypothetical protein